MKVRKAVVVAAGLGTRMLPATRVIPKEILPVVDRPAIRWWSKKRSPRALRKS